MLRRLLHLAVMKGTADIYTLASALDVSPQQARQMIGELERHGYFEQIAAGCEQPCERCPLRAACLYRNRPHVWILTRKGERFLGRAGHHSPE